MAKLYFRYGAMNSGKSTALMQVAHNYAERGMRAVILKPQIDSKGGGKVISRLGVDKPADCLLGGQDDVDTIIQENVREHGTLDCILVDEAQFLKTHQVDQLFWFAVREKIPVICYGLRTDFKLDGFEGSQRLLLMAHSVEELKTICRCGRKAVFNGRKVNGKFVFEGAQVAIDGENRIEYESLCADCYARYSQGQE